MAGNAKPVPLSELGKRRRTPKEADDARADAGKTTRETKRGGLPQHARARSEYTHVLKGEEGVRFVRSADDDALWGVFATKAELAELMPGAGDTVTVLDRKTRAPTTLEVEQASADSRCYWKLAVKSNGI